MKWREVATYLLLFKILGNRRVEPFMIIEFLKLFYGRRNAKRELRRLINLGLIRKIGTELEVVDINEFINSRIIPYIMRRMLRKLRNIDRMSDIIISNNSIKIVCHNNDCVRYVEIHRDILSLLPLEVELEVK